MIEFTLNKPYSYGLIKGDLFDDIREHFSVRNDAAKYSGFSHFLPKRLYMITPTGRFDPPLFYEIEKYIISQNYTDKIVVDDLMFKSAIKPAPLNWAAHPKFYTELYNLNLPLRDYQEEVVKKCLEHGRGTVILATAGGKTLIMASLLSKCFQFYNKSDFKCLVIVPDLGLVNQTFKDFTDYKVPFTFSKWTGTIELDLSSNVIIANAGILTSKNSDIDWINHVQIVVCDETHKLRHNNKLSDIVSDIRTYHKFGFTGTMPENLLDQWNIIGKIGPILYEKNSFDLRQESFISPVLCQVIEIKYKDKISSSDREGTINEYRAEMNFLIRNNFRNTIISKIANGVKNNCLILVDYIEHGLILEEYCKKECSNKQVFFIQGDVEVGKRDDIKKIMEENNNVIIIAISKIFSTGINILNLHYILFAGGGKAKVRVIQSIGRGLRLCKNKNILTILDIADQVKYGIRHEKKRQNLYESEKINYTIKTINQS